ncbi:MAG: four helix bundle protein [Bacteroidales bacterium]|nr:four helix bundle protein [Bacteroidales bacterium]
MASGRKNIIREKSFLFAIQIVNLYKYLSNEKREYVMSRQLLKAGTSIGANVREADNAESKADFIHKMGIAQKEADETLYWLELLSATDFISREDFESLNFSAEEIFKIIRSIILTAKENGPLKSKS